MALNAQRAMCYCLVIMLGGSATAGLTICAFSEEHAEVECQSADIKLPRISPDPADYRTRYRVLHGGVDQLAVM